MDGTVRLWDVSAALQPGGEAQEVLSLAAHSGGTLAVTWSPDGTRFATAGVDGAARVWDAGTGALLLFGSVQITMIIWALFSGERPLPGRWLGMATALIGFIYLVLPGVTAPSPAGAALMTAAGISWGFYSLRRKGHTDPLAATAGNFLRAAPMALVVSLVLLSGTHVSARGIVLALASGAVASGLGYVVWYAALRGLSASGAAVVQISVAPIAALGGVLFLGEAVSARLLIASILILGGITVALLSRPRAA